MSIKFEPFDFAKAKYIKWDQDNVIDIRVILFRYPEAPNEAGNKGYVDKKVSEVKAEDFKGVLKHENIPNFKGPDIVTPNEKTMNLREIHKEDLPLGVMIQVDEHGRILSTHGISDSDLDPSVKFKWGNVTDKPTTTDGFNITDLIRYNREDRIKSDTTVNDYKGKASRSPMPIEYLDVKFEQIKASQKPVGSSIVVHDGASPGNAILSNGATISSDRFPELVLHLTKNPKATSAVLPDRTKDDSIRFGLTGVNAHTYIIYK